MRFFARLSYKGTAYHGWQIQPNGISVQEVLEKAFSTILQTKTAITGAGRTDAGVHARNYIAHFEMDNKTFSNDLPLFIYKINSFLPKDIVIHDVYKVESDSHARFDAKSRTYNYYISHQKNPFRNDTAWLRLGSLDIDLMNKACEILKTTTDFTSFAKLHTDNKTNICNLMQAHWQQTDELIIFEIKADRFLRNMVRAIVGTMVDIGRHKITLDDFKEIIKSKNRNNAGVSAPAKGLFLEAIYY